MSPMYKVIKLKYDKGYIRKDQLRKYVELGVITREEFKSICGDDYDNIEEGDGNGETI